MPKGLKAKGLLSPLRGPLLCPPVGAKAKGLSVPKGLSALWGYIAPALRETNIMRLRCLAVSLSFGPLLCLKALGFLVTPEGPKGARRGGRNI